MPIKETVVKVLKSTEFEVLIVLIALTVVGLWANHDGVMNGKIELCNKLNGTFVKNTNTNELYCDFMIQHTQEFKQAFPETNNEVFNWSIT